MTRKRIISAAAVGALLLTIAGCAATPTTTSSAPQLTTQSASAAGAGEAEHPPKEVVTIPAPSLTGNLVEEPTQQDIEVLVPADYNTTNTRYPVVYYLPGFGDPFKVFVTGASDSMILVSINGINRLGGSFYYNSPVTGNWEDFVTQDVVSYIDSNYRTIAEPDGRAIAGHSMGGFGVLNAAMHTDVYSYAYAMSPGVFNDEGLSKFALQYSTLTTFIDSIADLDDTAARKAYLTMLESQSWPANLSFAYAATFAPDAAGRAPYVELPAQDPTGEYVHDATWEKYDAGYGDLPAKLEAYGDNLSKLKGLVIEYGTSDEFRFIPEGCDYLSALLQERGIDHELLTYTGGHASKLFSRISDFMLPYLADKFSAAAS